MSLDHLVVLGEKQSELGLWRRSCLLLFWHQLPLIKGLFLFTWQRSRHWTIWHLPWRQCLLMDAVPLYRPHTGFLIRFHTTPAFLTSPWLPLLPRSDILHLLCFAVYTLNACKGRSSMCLAQRASEWRAVVVLLSHPSLFSFHPSHYVISPHTLIRSLQDVAALIFFKPFTMKLCLQKGLGHTKHRMK